MKKILIILILIISSVSIKSQNNYYEKGMANYESKNYAAAIGDLTKVIETDEKGDVMSALYIRAQCKNKLEDFRGALLDYNTVLHIVREEETEALAVVYLDRGRVKAILEDYTGAETDFSKAIKLKKSYAEAYINRGIIRNSFLNKMEMGCMDFSRAGELGITKAYEFIKEYCN